jgi:hypothetical protein
VPFFSGTATLPFVRRFGLKEVEAATNGFTAVVAGVQGPLRRRPRGDGPAGERRGGWTREGDFYREVQLLGRLNHRHVVRLHGFSEGHHHHNRFVPLLSVLVPRDANVRHDSSGCGIWCSGFLTKKDLALRGRK